MNKKKSVVKKSTGGHIKHMGHGTDDMTMIIIAGGAFLVMVAVVVLSSSMTPQLSSPVTQVSASNSAR